jgi:hypothetical protein
MIVVTPIREDTFPAHVVARVICTYVVVFAYDAFAEVLSAHPFYTDFARTAGCAISHPPILTPVCDLAKYLVVRRAAVHSARIAVVAVSARTLIAAAHHAQGP